ncbi:alpha-L-fucosidase C-terminal domain-containing protein, partial [Xanthomonas citri]
PWRVYGEGPTGVVGGTFQDIKTKPYTAEDFRFTTRDGALYAIELGWPSNGEAVIRSLKAADGVRAVTLLANGKKIPFEQRADGLHLHLPVKPVGESAYVFRIDLSSPTP